MGNSSGDGVARRSVAIALWARIMLTPAKIILTFFIGVCQYRVALSPLGVSPQGAPPDPLPAGLTASERLVRTTKKNNTKTNAHLQRMLVFVR
jgi:hypothetical protein